MSLICKLKKSGRHRVTPLTRPSPLLGTSHNLRWRGEGGGGGGEIGGPSIFFGWNMEGLKMPKDDLGGGLQVSFK